MWRRTRRGKGRGSYRGKNATEGKTETMNVGIAVGVVFHRGLGGVVGDVVRLGGQRGLDERIKGTMEWLDRGATSRKDNNHHCIEWIVDTTRKNGEKGTRKKEKGEEERSCGEHNG